MTAALPKPRTCPVCGTEIEQRVQIIQMLRRGRPDAWRYTGPGASKEKGTESRTRTVRRPIYVCSKCSIRVQLHRDRKAGRETA